jgi:Zn-dependent protease
MSAWVWLVPLLPAIVLHEAAHAYAARSFGDFTAHDAGRCTLNPLAHLDLMGGLFVPAVLLSFFGVMFGYAKPLPVDYERLGRNGAYVALAGCGANVLQLGAWAIAGLVWPCALVTAGVLVNVLLCFVNLIPLKPLDGWWAFEALRGR